MTGESLTLSVVADGGTGTTLSYQWSKSGVVIAGARPAEEAASRISCTPGRLPTRRKRSVTYYQAGLTPPLYCHLALPSL